MGSQPVTSTRPTLRAQLRAEASAMASYAVSAGIAVPASLLVAIDAPPAPGEDGEIVRLSAAHEHLVRMIAPVRPSLVMALAEGADEAGALRVLGRVLLVRYKMLLALGSLVTFIALSLTDYINDERNGRIFESSGLSLLVCELFFLSAAGLGASFAGLFQADREIMAGTFDPRHQSSYWMRFLLGLIAGLLLATLLDVRGSGASQEGAAGSGMRLSEAALALLGGFSSSVVFRILNRLVETLETMVRGSASNSSRSARSWYSGCRASSRTSRATPIRSARGSNSTPSRAGCSKGASSTCWARRSRRRASARITSTLPWGRPISR